MLDLSNTHHFRKTVAGACMILAPLLFLLGVIIHPELSTSEAEQLGFVAADVDAFYAAHMLIFAGIVLAVPAVLGLMHMLRERGAAYGHLGGGLALIGLLCYAAVQGVDMVIWQMGAAGADRGEMTALLTRLTETTGFVIPFAILPFAFAVGTVVLAMGLYRARAVEAWMAAALAIGGVAVTLIGVVVTAYLYSIVAAAVLFVGLAAIGQMVLVESDADWEHTPESRGYRPLAGMR
jgi:hypothetical protein